MQVKIKRLNPNSVIPSYQSKGASGFDFHAIENTVVPAGKTLLIKTGLSFEIPEGFELQVRPRSGMSLKTGMRVTNSPGTVDADYRGEVSIIMENTSDKEYIVNVGDRVAQGVVCPVNQVQFIEEELSSTERGAGGFGSSGS